MKKQKQKKPDWELSYNVRIATQTMLLKVVKVSKRSHKIIFLGGTYIAKGREAIPAFIHNLLKSH